MSLVDYAIAVRRRPEWRRCVCSQACGWRGR
jgi:hypothetical protein